MSITVSIDDKAKQWLLNKCNALTISRLSLNTCCVPGEEVTVSYQEPSEGNYQLINQEDLTIYIDKSLEFKNNHAEIKMSGFKPFQTIQVLGFKRF